MRDPLRQLEERYASVLRAYVSAPTEAPREQAYQLGVEAISHGLGVLHLAAAHKEALLGVLVDSLTPEETERRAKLASELLVESLAPFEMTHRGFRETIGKLLAANEALRTSEAKNLALLNAIPDVMFRVRRDGTYLDFKARDGSGAAPPDEVVGRKVPEVLSAELARLVARGVERALQTGTTQVFEYQREMNGDRRDYEARLAVSGKDEVLGIVRDITERKRAEEARAGLIREQAARAEAEASQERIGNILESITDGFIALDRRWRLTYVNRQAEMILRKRREELIGKSLWEEFPGALGSEFGRGFHKAVAERLTVHLVEFYPPFDAWFEAHAYPSAEGLSVYFRDVTEERRRQRARLGLARVAREIAATPDVGQALATATVELVASFDIALARVWLWDEAEKLLVLRASAGLSTRTAATGSRFGRLQLGRFEIGTIAESRRPLATNALLQEAWLREPKWAKREGIVAFAGFPLLTGDQLLGVVGLFSRRGLDEDDLTALATLADQLAIAIDKARLLAEVQAALKLRQEFITAAVHELRTPVTALKGYAGLLRRLPDPHSPSFGKALNAVEASVGRIARLAEALVEADALERGAVALQLQRFDLAELARRVVEGARVEHPGFRFALETTPATVVADRERIGEVIRHLLDNAAKYEPAGGEIEVTVEVESGQALLTVIDHGVAIPRERQAHVFEPMYELIPSGAVGYVGVVGLGLAISKRLVDLHGGRIWFQSQPDKGNAFHFALPLAPASESEAAQP